MVTVPKAELSCRDFGEVYSDLKPKFYWIFNNRKVGGTGVTDCASRSEKLAAKRRTVLQFVARISDFRTVTVGTVFLRFSN